MLSPPIKQRVRESFDRAAVTYDGAAVLQRRVCDRLLDGLSLTGRPQRILDAGCGTGYGSRCLRQRWPDTHITGVDFAPAMLELARHETDTCQVADIETLPFTPQQFDLWWSSLSIQWCDSGRAFAEAARVLTPGGRLAVSTLGPATFGELRQAFSGLDHYRHTLPFSDSTAIASALRTAGFGELALRRVSISLHYADLKSLLHAVKAIGASGVGDGARRGMMGRTTWQALEAAYERQRTAAGLPASYDIILCTARKPTSA